MPKQLYKAERISFRAERAVENSKIEEVIQDLHSGTIPSIGKASQQHGIPYTALRMRMKVMLPRQEAHTHRQLLTTSQECLLEHYIKSMSVQGFPITYKHSTDRAAAFYRANQNQNVDDSDLDVSRRWVRGFLYRHPAVQSCFSRSIDHARAKGFEQDRH